MSEPAGIFIGKGDVPVSLDLKFVNRHGLIAGATGTGKTVTLQVLIEGLSAAGVPVFATDVKGDLSGIALPGVEKPAFAERAREVGLDPYVLEPHPVVFWDVFGKQGHKIRATVAEMGPQLVSRMLELDFINSDAKQGAIDVAFRIAEDEGLVMLDLDDLRAVLVRTAEKSSDFGIRYGFVGSATVGTIQRDLLSIENQGGRAFFGEPSLDVLDFAATDTDGRGTINILAADELINSPRVYATFMLWMLTELFERLPEVGDLDKPKLVLFFDEAHLLFDEAPKALIDKITRTVRLIRSKGVGVYFVTQNASDVPAAILGQLGNRIQHALRAYTPNEFRVVRAAAASFRPNPAFKTEEAITQLGTGEALVSTLQGDGVPSMVERVMIRPPSGRVGALSFEERKAIVKSSPLMGKYEAAVSRESAFATLEPKPKPEVPKQKFPKPPEVSEERNGDHGWIDEIIGGCSRSKQMTPPIPATRPIVDMSFFRKFFSILSS